MFKSIRAALDRKRTTIARQGDVSVLVRRAVSEYLSETYPDALQRIAVTYDEAEGVVAIHTPSKALAAELTLNISDVRAHLTTRNIRVKRIVAR